MTVDLPAPFGPTTQVMAPSGTPTGTALHEFGHVISHQAGSRRAAYDSAVALAEQAGAMPSYFIAKHVSRYASSSMEEFSAEAFADVMTNGANASHVSTAAFNVMQSAYQGSVSK